jgi:hypothetical protein
VAVAASVVLTAVGVVMTVWATDFGQSPFANRFQSPSFVTEGLGRILSEKSGKLAKTEENCS